MDDAFVTRLHIGRGEWRSIVKQNILAELEGIAHAIRGFLHGFGQFRDGLVVLIARNQRFVDVHRDDVSCRTQ